MGFKDENIIYDGYVLYIHWTPAVRPAPFIACRSDDESTYLNRRIIFFFFFLIYCDQHSHRGLKRKRRAACIDIGIPIYACQEVCALSTRNAFYGSGRRKGICLYQVPDE